MTRFVWTPETRARAIEMALAGKINQVIGEAVGAGRETVRDLLRREGVSRPAKRRFTPEEQREMQRLRVKEFWTYAKIGTQYGITGAGARRIVLAQGAEIRIDVPPGTRRLARDYSTDDDCLMKHWREAGMPVEEIGQRLDRTGSAIRVRLTLLADRAMLPKNDWAMRPCLGPGCDRKLFRSAGIEHRLCKACRLLVDGIAA